MKHKLTYTDNYILVVDNSEIKEGDWMHRNDEQPTFVTPNFWWDFKDKYRKITAHLPLNNSPILKGVPLLPSMKVKDDVEKLAWELFGNDYNARARYKDGYNKAKEKYRWTDEDVVRIVEKIRETGLTAEYLILSLSQPKMPSYFEYIDTITTDEGTYPEWVGDYIQEP